MPEAEAAVIELVEGGSADQCARAVGVDTVEQAGEEFAAAESLYFVDVAVLFLAQSEEAFGHLILRERLDAFDEEDADAGVRGLGRGGAAVAVRGGKVLDGFAADEEVFELAVYDEVDWLRGDAFVVDRVGADEFLAGEPGLERVVGDAEALGEDTRSKARRVGPGGAGGRAHLGGGRLRCWARRGGRRRRTWRLR